MIISNATIINEGERFTGSLVVNNGLICDILHGEQNPGNEEIIDATGCYLIPGIIDDHVHMREPGLTHKADMETETCAAAAGGVTTVLDMPNVNPQNTTNLLLKERYKMAETRCHVNYGFLLGATNDNLEEITKVDTTLVPAVKLFMGSSTGNMLVDDERVLRKIFECSPTLIMAHCEDSERINQRMKEAQERYGDDPAVIHHPDIRDRIACLQSSTLAVKLARETGARLHIAHLSTKEELDLLTPKDTQITGEACVAHLLWSREDYDRLGALIKCNPAIKEKSDRDALRKALTDGRIKVIGTDHAPHLLSEKQGGCKNACSGIPMIQFSLVSMLELVDKNMLTIEKIVELMCHNPASLFRIDKRGYIRKGYHADLVLVRPNAPWKITQECIQSKCGWSPRLNDTFNWRIERTWVNGEVVWDGTKVHTNVYGKAIRINS
ncbi:MAG: dihydroorotase [Bacteroidaceae bacterium]